MDLKLLSRMTPVVEVKTSAGRIYLYPLRIRDITDFEKLKSTEAINQVRDFLACIGSLTLESDETPERIPLSPEITKTISDDEVERLAEAYMQSPEWQTVEEGSQERKPVAREDGETASAYLIRRMKDEVEQQHQLTKQLREKMPGYSRGLFDQARKSAFTLGSTLSAFEKFTKPKSVTPLNLEQVQSSVIAEMAQQTREREKERAEEMQLTRLTGQMTAESAKALKDLVDAATTMMEQMVERDQRNDQSTRTQIKIALWSVAASAFLALVAVIFSGLSYIQDRNSNTVDDQWQAKVLTAVEQVSQQRSTLERENQALLAQVKLQGARIADMETAQRANAKSREPQRTPRP